MRAEILAALLLCGCVSAAASSGLRLTGEGATAYRIYMPADADSTDRYAARELQDHFKNMSGFPSTRVH